MNAPALSLSFAVAQAPPARRTGWITILWPALLLLLVIACVSPSGFVGAGYDDARYLEAAQCAAREAAMCVPANHWATRWTVVAPVAAVIRLAGESRAAFSLVPLLYALACIVAAAALARRLGGPLAARIAALALAATPLFTRSWLAPNVDRAELLFLLLSALALLRARHAPRWSLLAGALFALAVASRPSAIAWGPLLAPLALVGPGAVRRVASAALGGLAVFGAELAAYAWWTGDPFFHLRLALAHTAIPTSELPRGFPRGESPLFNPRYVDAWTPAMGISVHWAVDPLLNLLLHPLLGWTLLGSAALASVARLPRRGLMIAAAFASFAILAYALAIDPKPRMFMPLGAVAAIATGLAGAKLWRRGQVLPVVALLTVGATVALGTAVRDPDLRAADRVATAWLAAHGPHRIHPNDARALLLVPAAFRPAPPHAPTLGFRQRPCAKGIPGPHMRVLDEAVIPSSLDRLRGPAPDALRLCRWG